MSAKPLVLGEAPSRTGDVGWEYPLWGTTSKLCFWMGIEPEPGYDYVDDGYYAAFRRLFDVANLIDRYPGRASSGGAAFPMGLAREAWRAMLPDLRGRSVVLLGRRLQAVAGMEHVGWHVRDVVEGDVMVVAVPHPSGLNRIYNDPVEREATAATLREALRTRG